MPLTRILGDVRRIFPPHDDLWYILSAAVISALNRPEDIGTLYRVVEQSVKDKVPPPNDRVEELTRVTLRMREGIFTSFIGSGFPKVINALDHLRQATPEEVKERLPKKPLRSENTWQQVLDHRKRGSELFATIYERHTERVIQSMNASYPDLAQTALHTMYGTILSGAPILSGKESSMTLATTLLTLDLPSQLRGHIYGAMHQGATKEDVDRFHKLVAALRQHYGIPLGTVRL